MDYHPVENTCYAVSFFRASSKWCPLSILLLGTYFSCINLFSFVFVPLTPIWMKFCLRNMMSSSEFDESGVLCSIWTKCDCVYFFDTKLCFDVMALLAWWSAPEVFSSENVNNKMNNHILFICYTIQQIHQILKCSSCFLNNLPSIHWFMTRICHIQYFSWYN